MHTFAIATTVNDFTMFISELKKSSERAVEAWLCWEIKCCGPFHAKAPTPKLVKGHA